MHSACIRDNSVGLGDEAPNNFYGEAGRVIMRRSVEPVYIGLIPMPLPKFYGPGAEAQESPARILR